MTYTKFAIGFGLAFLGFLCWMAAVGVSAVREGLISVFVLAVLVAGGNWLAGRSSYGPRRRPEPTQRGAPERAGARSPEAAPSDDTGS